MTTETPDKRKWRDPIPASVSSFGWNTVVKVPKPTGPRCKACKGDTAREGSLFCGEWCEASWNAVEGAAK